MEIKHARAEEWEVIRDLRLRALIDAPDAFGSTYEEESAHGEEGWRTWVSGWSGAEQVTVLAFDGDTPLGLAVGARWQPSDAAAHLFAMWVDPAQRGAGVGTALVEAVVRWVRVIGAQALELRVTETNTAAIGLYERTGFVPTGERGALREGSGIATLAMRRDLRP